MGQKITNDQAKKLFENWSKNGPGKAVKNAGFKDTYETWFSAAELRDYCQEIIESIGIENNPGIRIYFGNYGDNTGQKKNECTVFLSPTKGGRPDDLANVPPQNDYSLQSYNSGTGGNPPKAYDPTQ